MTEPGIDWMQVSFRKSSYSNTTGGNCVEVGWADVPFRKSSFSTNGGEACVEVGALPSAIGIRDSKNPAGGLLVLPAAAWAPFTDRVTSAS
jgi:hypothetical protein